MCLQKISTLSLRGGGVQVSEIYRGRDRGEGTARGVGQIEL